MTKHKCPSGEYYCYTDKKCKPIPKGFKMVGPAGYLRKENGHSVEDEAETKKNGNGNGGDSVSEDNKSGDSSLRDWFGKSKSSDGKPGWVQLGGKYAGKPCAKQPGQTTKPKCGSSKMKRNLSKDEEEAAFRRKNRKDPNPDRKGKAINVATEEFIPEEEKTELQKKASRGDKDAMKKLHQLRAAGKIGKEYGFEPKEEVELTTEGKGEKDACYHKVKSRYSVWPSAYASGALVKCRKVGAKNWGNKSKKNEEFTPIQIAALESIDAVEVNEAGQKCWKGYEKKGTKKMFGKTYNNCVKKEDIELTDVYGDTLAVIQDVVKPEPLQPSTSNIEYETYDIEAMVEATRIPAKTGNIVKVFLSWRGKFYSIQMFFPSVKVPGRSEIQDQINKVYPGAKVQNYVVTDYEPGNPLLHTEGAAWTKKEGKSKSGGLNEKGRKSYERENPGSDLKAPSKKVGNPRRASFCARMKGMKKKLTSKKTANDPDSRINKSLRAWNC